MTITPARAGMEAVVPRLTIEETRSRATEAGMDAALADIHLFQVLFHSPALANAINSAKDGVLKETQLDPRLREFIIMRVAWLTGAEYVWDHHYKPHVEHGLNVKPEGILGVRDPTNAAQFGDVELAVIAVADDVVSSGRVSQATIERCREFLPGNQEIVEAVATACVYNAIAGVALSLSVPIEEGYTRWEPDGVEPS